VTREVEDIYELSPLQRGMLFHTLAAPGSNVYVVQVCYRIDGPLDPARLARAWELVIEWTPVLRTTFSWAEVEKPLQIVHRAVRAEWTTHDLRGAPERRNEIQRADQLRPFELADPPLTRFTLLRLGEERYELLWTTHHILLDGWSWPLILEDVSLAYEALARGEMPARPRRPLFRDFISAVADTNPRPLERSWRQMLGGVSAATPLGFDRSASDKALGYGVKTLSLGEVAAAVEVFARRHGVTPSTLAHGAWAILLSRSSRLDDVVFGSVSSGRSAPVPRIEALIGPCLVTLPVRVRVDRDARLVPWLRALQENLFDVRQLERSSLVDIQGWTDIPRGRPLFESTFAYENYPVGEVRLGPGVEIRRQEINERSSDPLTLSITAGVVQAGYERSRIDDASIDRILERYRVLLGAMAVSPEARIGALEHLPQAERRRVLVEWNATAHPPPRSFLERFEAQAARTPDAAALVFGDRTMSYRALERRANQLAHRLGALGVRRGDRVAFATDRSIEMIVGMLGIMKAGAAYLALDPGHPKDRLSFLLSDGAPRALLFEAHLAARLPAHDLPTVALDPLGASIASEPETSLGHKPLPEEAAYVLYTSGSTGRPKGVLVPHRGLSNLIEWTLRYYGLGQGERASQIAGFTFDGSLFEIGPALSIGATLFIADEETRGTPSMLVDWLVTKRIQHAYMPTIFSEGILAERWPERCDLRVVLTGGETLHAPSRWAKPPFRLSNTYGPTECTVTNSAGWVDPRSNEAPSIGSAIDNNQLYVLDPHLEPVGIGIPGELCIAGDGLALGYLGRPDLTAERFFPNPFAETLGARMYRTGDLARFREDGSLDFLGRIDQQLKIRGVRIELGEIETALAEHTAVKEAVVLGMGEDRLVAYVVTKSGSTAPAAHELRDHLRRTLPEPMIPAAYVALERLPMTANGKVDRRKLPEPGAGDFGAAAGTAAPRSPDEEILVGIWREVLGLERVGIRDDFFDLGGHSLLATQVVSRARRTLDLDLDLRDLLDLRTIERLGERVRALRSAGATAQDPPIERIGAVDAPLSCAQERLWFLDRLEGRSASYNMAWTIEIDGPFDADLLEKCIAEIVRRQEALRTRFVAVDGRPTQVVMPETSVKLARTAASEEEAERIATEDARRPFDLERDAPFRARLVAVGPQRHLLILIFHHGAADGWSMGVFNKELAALYAGASLPELPIRYRDAAAWERRWLSGDRARRQIDYWREKLAGSPEALALPTDRPRPAQRSGEGAVCFRRMRGALAARLESLGRTEDATLFMVLLCAFEVLLHRLSGETDLVIGTAIARRDRAETEPLVGLFLNNLALRGDLSGDPSFIEALARSRTAALEAYANADLPFEKVVEELNPERRLSHTPLFQVMLNFQEGLGDPLALPGLELKTRFIETETARLDLRVSITRAKDALEIHTEYATDLFEAATIERWLDAYETLLASAAETPERLISELEILPATDRRRILGEWNAPVRPGRSAGKSLGELFEEQVARTPNATAIVAGDRAMTFSELDRAANLAARVLIANGARPDALIGLAAARTTDMVVGLIAILKSGAAYVPLDPEYPRERLEHILQEARVEILAGQREVIERLPRLGAKLVHLDADHGALDESPLPRTARPSHLAYGIYTSGSTGVPKGVLIEQRNIVDYFDAMDTAIPLSTTGGRPAVWLAVTSLSFDPSLRELMWTLTRGVKVVIEQRGAADGVESGQSAPELILRHGATHMNCTPSMARVLLSSDRGPAAMSTLDHLLLAGERVDAALASELVALLGPHGGQLHNVYGPTETTCSTCTDPIARAAEPIPVGRPMTNRQAFVVDAGLELVPIGVGGELCIAGAGLGRGYLRRPDLTAERFVPNPFSREPGARMYRTGDRARALPDGRIEIVGRLDRQVKMRGIRIELREIEQVVGAHPAIAACVTLLREDTPGDQRLVAYCVPREGRSLPSVAELRELAVEKMPAYMVPVAFVGLDALPLTPNRKIDRQALPMPDAAHIARTTFVAPDTRSEKALASIWSDVLKVPEIGRHDNFFELGGHSLIATLVAARIEKAFEIEFELVTLFASPTLAELAASIDQACAERAAAVPLVPVPRDGELPLSFGQQQLWLIHQLEGPSDPYRLLEGLRFFGPLDVPALERALTEIARRHEILRTTLPNEDGQPRQVIAPPLARWVLPVDDLSGASPEERDAIARERGREEGLKPFSLDRGPLVRIRLLRLATEDHLLLLSIHHSVFDGWSFRVLHKELAALYSAFSRGEPSPLTELAIQYADYGSWQRKRLTPELIEAQVDYWRTRLSGSLPLLELPADRPRPAVKTNRGAVLETTLSKDLQDTIESFGLAESATLFMVLLAAFDALLVRYTGQEDLPIGVPHGMRSRPELEPLIGYIVNTLVIRSDASGDPSFRELLARVRRDALEAYANQDVPFERVVEAVRPERSLSHTPLFQVMFVAESSDADELRFAGLRARREDVAKDTSFFDLSVFALATPQGLRLLFRYDRDVIDRPRIERMVGHFEQVLKSAMQDPDRRVSKLRVLTAAEEAQLSLWSARPVDLGEGVNEARIVDRFGELVPVGITGDLALGPAREKSGRRARYSARGEIEIVSGLEDEPLAIAATFTAEPIEAPLRFWAKELRAPLTPVFAPYNQVLQQLHDPQSVVSKNAGVVLVRVEDFVRDAPEDADLRALFDRAASDLISAVRAALANARPSLVLCFCPASTASVRVAATEARVLDALTGAPGLTLITSQEVLSLYSSERFDDPLADREAHVPYSDEGFAALGTIVMRRIHALRRPPKKVLSLDCDNTLWRGIVGEDGTEGISPNLAVQRFAVDQQAKGVLIVLCSKNNPADVWDVLDRRPDMILKREHVLTARIDWAPKSEGLASMAKELGLGLDSFVHLDDSSMECAEIRTRHPEVLAIELPLEGTDRFLRHLWPLDLSEASAEDKKRTEMYRQNVAREEARRRSRSLDEFLAGIELVVDVRALEPEHLPRAAQLTQRTNQFNVSSIRRTEAELRLVLAEAGMVARIVKVRDRFGDYGLVGVMLARKTERAISVDTMLLSCRALGRGVEHRMIAALGAIAAESGLEAVELRCVPNPKNQPAREFLSRIAGTPEALAQGALLYRLSAAEARALVDRVAESPAAPAPADVDAPPAPRSKAATGLDAPAAIRIATDLATPQDVLRAIAAAEPKRAAATKTKHVAPRTPAEKTLAGIWGEVLGIEDVGIHDSFFDLGGHSLLATKALSRIQRAFGVEIELRAIFQHPSVEALAAQIQGLIGVRTVDRPLVPVPRDGELPLSFAQEQLWLVHQLERDLDPYRSMQALRFEGPLDLRALEKSLAQMVRRHETLRTTYRAIDGRPVQLIAPPPGDWTLPIEDLARLTPELREAEAKKRALEEGSLPFSLARGPLFRARMLRLSPEENLLLLTLHHSIYDRWSFGVVCKDLAALYRSFTTGAPSGLPDLEIQYADFASWQRKELAGGALDAQLEHWKAKLEGAPPLLDLPADRPRPAVRSTRGRGYEVMLPPTLVDSLEGLARQEGSTLFMVLLAALDALLARYTGRKDIVVGVPIANRARAELEPLIGFFVNTLVMRTDLSADPPFRALLRRVRDVSLEAHANKDVPFEKLVAALRPARSLAYTPLFQVMFVFQNAPTSDLEMQGVRVRPESVERDLSLCDLSLFCGALPEGMKLIFQYDSELFEPARIARMAGHFIEILKSAAGDSERRLSELRLLTAEEESRLYASIDLGSGPIEAWVADRWGARVPVGVPGELCLGADRRPSGRRAQYAASGAIELLAGGAQERLAICATFTAEPIEASLRHWATELGLQLTPVFGQYNQVLQELHDPDSVVSRSDACLLIRLEDFVRDRPSGAEVRPLLERAGRDLLAGVRAALGRRSAGPRLVLCFCPASRSASSFAPLLAEIQARLAAELEAAPAVTVIAPFAASDFDDPIADREAHVPYTDEGFAALGTALICAIDPAAKMRIDADRPSPSEIVAAIASSRFASDSIRKTPFVAPRTDVEGALVGIWAEVLGLEERVGIHDSFFDLGGHSLLAAKALSRIHRLFQVELELKTIFQNPSVAAIGARVEEARLGVVPGTREGPPLVPVLRNGARLPLSLTQQALWSFAKQDGHHGYATLQLSFRMRGALDLEALRSTIDGLAARHEILRTTIGEEGGVAYQRIAKPGAVPLEVFDLRAHSAAERDARTIEIESARLAKPMDMVRGPLFTAAMYVHGPEDHVLVLELDHSLGDGVSMRVLLRDFAALYRASAGHEQPVLPSLALQYADFACWEEQAGAGGLFTQDLEYWERQMSGARPIALAGDAIASPAPRAGTGQRLVLPADLAREVRKVGPPEGATTFMVLLAAYKVLLSSLSGQEDVVVGASVANRPFEELNDLVGFFARGIFLRTNLGGRPSAREAVRRARDVFLASEQHARGPIVEALPAFPGYKAMINFFHESPPDVRLPGLEISAFRLPLTTGSDLRLLILDDPLGTITLPLLYRADRFRPETVEAMLERYQRILEALVEYPDRPISTE
jgi:amino acid adenylation domain-containing protein/FkbH-like protein